VRRSEPLFSSDKLGPSFKYSENQLKAKSKNLKDFNITYDRSSPEEVKQEMAKIYMNEIENLLKKDNLIIHENGTLNQKDRAFIAGDPDSRIAVAFEDHPAYGDKFFVSSYGLTNEEFNTYNDTGNVGLSAQERIEKNKNNIKPNKVQKKDQTQIDREFIKLYLIMLA